LERVRKSAHAVCPHCQGKIEEKHKPAMNARGVWKATNPNARRGFVSRHLPSLCAATPETSFGAIAVKFLEAKRSLLGLQGFINGELAEPYEAQDTIGKRVELVSKETTITGEQWTIQMTIDCQAKAPYFWYVVRAWMPGRTEGIVAGNCTTWDDVESIQHANKVPDVQVMPDSGFGSRSDLDVYRACVQRCEMEPRRDKLPLAIGWMPSKGMPGKTKWKDEDGLLVPYRLQPTDPFIGTSDAGQIELSLFEFSGDYFKDVLKEMRQPGNGKFQWSVSKQMDDDVYWRHMDGEIKKAVYNPRDGKVTHIWARRGNFWPNHLWDCEVMQVALAAFFKLINLPE
jgi:hypothetical protein